MFAHPTTENAMAPARAWALYILLFLACEVFSTATDNDAGQKKKDHKRDLRVS